MDGGKETKCMTSGGSKRAFGVERTEVIRCVQGRRKIWYGRMDVRQGAGTRLYKTRSFSIVWRTIARSYTMEILTTLLGVERIKK